MSLDEQMALLYEEEARESLREFEHALLLLESLPDDQELVARLFRCTHTLKGNSRIMGYEVVARFSHELENLLDVLRRGDLMVSHTVADALLSSLDLLKSLVDEVAGGPTHSVDSYAECLARLQNLARDLERGNGASGAPPQPPLQFQEPGPPLHSRQSGGPVPEGAGNERPTLPPAQVVLSMTAAGNDDGAVRQVEPAGDVVQREERPREPKATVRDAESSSVRVPIEKLDRLINLTGEVVIAQSMIAQLVTDLTPERISVLQEVVAQMDRHCRELQERMLGARMLPVRNVFARFHRVVRDLSASTGKAVVLELLGEDTELDKTVIEKIADPLTHLVRNAIDHGIETPEERAAAGKPAQAKVSLSAYQKGGSIFIEVGDDGRGIDRNKVLAKAKQKGLLRDDAQPSDDEILALLFLPGFSTAEHITELSGRGVGMDVVKRNVESLKGVISTTSTPGQGTCFRLKLPLTLAILDGLGVRVGEDVFLVPLVSVVESLQPNARDVYALPSAGEVVDVRGDYLPLVRLFEVFTIEPQFRRAEQGIVMVLDDGTQRVALQVDELIGQYQVVIKSLETNFCSVPGVGGATVLGDGRVALILDVGQLASIARVHAGRAFEGVSPRQVAAAAGGAV